MAVSNLKATRPTALLRIRLLIISAILFNSGQLFGQSLRFNDALVSTVLNEIEETYGKRFLYRDAIVAGKRISLSGNADNIMDLLESEMQSVDLALQESEHIIVVSEFSAEKENEKVSKNKTISGYVLDAETGSRLPGATILLRDSDTKSQGIGVISNVDGRFSLTVSDLKEKTLEVRYIGFKSFVLELNGSDDLNRLPIRLTPTVNSVSEVTVYGNHFQSHLDSTWNFLMKPTLPSGFDDQSLLRDFQVLPAINITSAISGDVNVRGSQASGFRVELDGSPIFGQQHLFGLYDVFNPDAISQSALYYGSSPSSFEDAGGGILSLRTRPASMTKARAMASISNSSGSLTIESPIVKERASLMISGRTSTPLASTWYDSEGVISRGLGIPVVLESGDTSLEQNLFDVDTHGSFYDLHTRLVIENPNGSKIDAVAYYANEMASGESLRVIPPPSFPNRPPTTFNIQNDQQWVNILGRLSYSWVAADRIHMAASVSSSSYEGGIIKDDLLERRNGDLKFSSYENKNEMSEVKASFQSFVTLNGNSSLELGLKVKRLNSTYLDILRGETRVDASISPTLLDGSVGYNLQLGSVSGNIGLRSQYDIDRETSVLSPKVILSGSVSDSYSWSLSASRNNEFIQNLDLGSDLRSNIWLAGSENSLPTETNAFSLSNQFQLGHKFALRVDGYVKKINNLWEYRAGRRSNTVDGLGFLSYDSESFSRGVEIMTSARLTNELQATLNYTLSKSGVWNQRSANGQRFDAEWDRRHQISSRIKGNIGDRLTFSLTGLFATGAPNELRFDSSNEPERLGNYLRMDLGIDTRWNLANKPLHLSLYCFNLIDRANPWYRTPVSFVNKEPNQDGERDPRFVNVDVYDLGIMPSFKLRLGL